MEVSWRRRMITPNRVDVLAAVVALSCLFSCTRFDHGLLYILATMPTNANQIFTSFHPSIRSKAIVKVHVKHIFRTKTLSNTFPLLTHVQSPPQPIHPSHQHQLSNDIAPLTFDKVSTFQVVYLTRDGRVSQMQTKSSNVSRRKTLRFLFIAQF